MKKHCIAIKLILPIVFLLHVSVLPIVAKEAFKEESTKNMLYIRGLVSRVYPEKMEISVKPPKGRRVIITINPDTIMEGVFQIDEFEIEQQVKVWYSTNQGENQAIKVIKMMELGC